VEAAAGTQTHGQTGVGETGVSGDPGLSRLRHDTDFTAFFEIAWPRLFRTALAIAGDRGSAEDALQTAFAKAYASWSRVSSADHPEAYVRRMVVNEIIGSRRHGWWRRERPYEDVGASAAAPSPEQGVVDRDAVWEAVQQLPLRQRAVVVLRYYEDLSEAQIAETLGCSRGTVKSQASAALANLRRTGADLRGGDA
jgi:RNA polymerase sigma-70 factor (sigma-E family)